MSAELDRLPCGCRMGQINDCFVMEPCSLDCEYARYALAESRRQGLPGYVMDAERPLQYRFRVDES